MSKTAGEGLRKWLENREFDGLFDEGSDCCCYLDAEGEEQCPRKCPVTECIAGKVKTETIVLKTLAMDILPATNPPFPPGA